MSENHASGKQVAKGAAWLIGFKLLDRSIGLVSTLVLARVLTPSDFGLVAMAMAVVALLELMGAFGFDSALIQRQDTERRHYDTAWTFNVIFGASIALLLVILAVPAAGFYKEPRLELMLPALAIGSLITGFENIGTVAFRKELNFNLEFRYLLFKRLAGFVATITLALTLRSFWALIFGVIIGKTLSVLISYYLHSYRPRFSLKARADLFGFSKWLFISNLIQFLHSRSTDFVLGRTVGSHGLGVYNLGAEIASMPATVLIAPLNRAVYPAYAKLAAQRAKLLERFLEVFGLINLFAFPVAVGLFFLADLVVHLLLGPQWEEAIPIIKILSLCGLVGALQGNMYVVLTAMGNPRANTILSGILLILSLPLVIYSSLQYGALGAAYAHFAAACFGFIGIVFVFKRVTGLWLMALVSVMWRPTLAAIVMGCVIYSTQAEINAGWPDILLIAQLGIFIFIGIFSYAAVIILFWFASGRPKSSELVVIYFLAKKFGINLDINKY